MSQETGVGEFPGAEYLESTFLGNTVLTWGIALGTAAAVFVVAYLARAAIVGYANRLARKERRGVADVLVRLARRLSVTLVVAVAIVAGSSALALSARVEKVLQVIVIAAVAWQALRWGHVLVQLGLEAFLRSRQTDEGEPDPALKASMGIVRFLAFVVLYAVVFLMAADNMGIDVTAMVAGLGIGGIAIALAVQNILGDLFSSLSIVLDKPFVVGDFVIVGEQMGTVERIGIKTTRVRSLSGEQLVFTNSDLLSSRIRNFKRMNERRIAFSVGVIYQTTAKQMEKIPGILQEAVEAQETARFDRSHFKSFGAFSLDFETVYHVLSSEYKVYMDTQQAINMHVFRRFADEGIEFAYPTQTLFVEKPGS